MTRKLLSRAIACFISVIMLVSLAVPVGAQLQEHNDGFIPITGVVGVPTTATAGQVVNLNRAPAGPITIQPANATSAQGLLDFHFVGGTGGLTAWYMQGDLTIEGVGPGTITISARVVDGLGPGQNFYSSNFTIDVAAALFVPVTGIGELPSAAMVNQPLTLTGDVQPSTATNRTIAWSVYSAGTTGAVINGNVFTASAAGVAVVRATVANGAAVDTPFVYNFEVEVVDDGGFVPVTAITGVPSQLADPTPFAAGVGLRPTTLRGVVEPYGATNQTIVWSVVDAGTTGAAITNNVITVNGVGSVTVRATVVEGLGVSNFTQDFTLEVVTPRFTLTHLSANGVEDSAVHMNEGWIRIDNEGGNQLGIGFRPLSERMELIIDDGWAFKDMAGDGVLHPYVDWRLDYRLRAENLVELLSMHEITGLMMHSGHTAAALNPSEANLNLIRNGLRAILVTTFPGGGIGGVGNATQWTNRMQRYAEDHCRLSIPINFSTDPRDYGGGAMDMSMFPTNMGLGATFDPFLAHEIQRRKSAEFRDVGITTYLGPMIDLASEPRWYRFTQTFSEDPVLLTDMVDATVSAFQSSFEYDVNGNPVDIGWGLQSVSAMMKHFSGDGASEGGRGSHSQHGHFNVFPGSVDRYGSPYPGFRMHYMAFTDGGMFPQGLAGPARAMMTNYSVAWDPAGEGSMYISATGTPDPRGSDFGVFGPHVATAISSYKNNLARRYGFEGPITTDWGAHAARRWGTNLHGVESTTVGYQVMRVIMAGSDQIGGMNNRAQMNDAFNYAARIYGYEVAVARWEESGRRFSENFFLLGLFDNPYRNLAETLDPVYGVAGTSNAAIAREARLRGVVMLSNNITTEVAGVEVHTPVVTEDWFETQWPNFEEGLAYRPTVYVPFEQRTAAWAFPGPNAAGRADLRAELDRYFNVITDILVDGNVVRPTAEVMATVDFAIVFSRNPVNQPGGTLWNQGWYGGTNSYHPVTLQFSPYVADGPYVRRESLAGHPVLAERYEGSPTGFRTIAGAAGRPTFGTAPVGHVTPPVILTDPPTPIPGTDGIYWARENRSYFGQPARIQNPDQLDAFRFTRDNVDGPVILGIDIWNPIIFAEVYDYVDAIFISFQSQDYRSMLPLMLGQIEPSALLPVQMPLDMDAVERQHEDVPRDMDVFVCSRGNGFDFAFGLNWSGRIQDWRTERYDIPVRWTPVNNPAEFIHVTGINVPASVGVGQSITLSNVTSVVPENASRSDIIWDVVDPGGTGALITDGVLTVTTPGTMTLRASVISGGEWNRIFVETFEVEAIIYQFSGTNPNVLRALLENEDVILSTRSNLGIFTHHSPFVIPAGRTLTVETALNISGNAELVVYGTLVVAEGGRINNQGGAGGTIRLAPGGTLVNNGHVENVTNSTFINNGTIINNERFEVRAGVTFGNVGVVIGVPLRIHQNAILVD